MPLHARRSVKIDIDWRVAWSALGVGALDDVEAGLGVEHPVEPMQ